MFARIVDDFSNKSFDHKNDLEKDKNNGTIFGDNEIRSELESRLGCL